MDKVVRIIGFVVFAVAAYMLAKDSGDIFPEKIVAIEPRYLYECDTGQRMIIIPSSDFATLSTELDGAQIMATRVENTSSYTYGTMTFRVSGDLVQIEQGTSTANCKLL